MLGAYRSEEIPRGHPLRRLRTDLRRAGRLAELGVGPLDPDATARIAAQSSRRRPRPHASRGPLRPHAGRAVLRGGARGGAPGRRPARARTAWPRARGRIERADSRDASRRAPRPRRGPLGRWTSRPSRRPPSSVSRSSSSCSRARPRRRPDRGPRPRSPPRGRAGDRGVPARPRPRGALRRYALAEASLLAPRAGRPPRSPRRRASADGRPLARCGRARTRATASRRGCATVLREVHAYRDAAAAARTALEIWPEGEDEQARLDVLEELGRCAQLCGELGEAGRAWEEVADGLHGQRGPAAARRGAAAAGDGLRAPGRLAEGGGRATRSSGRVRGRRSHAEAAVELYAASEALGRRRRNRAPPRSSRSRRRGAPGGSDVESRCLSSKGFKVGRSGTPRRGVELLRSALALAVDGNHVEAAVTAYWDARGDRERLGRLPDRGVGLRRRPRLLPGEPLERRRAPLRRLPGRGAGKLGRVDARGAAGARSSRAALASEVRTAHAVLTLGLIAAARGATKRGRRLLVRALAMARELGMVESSHECEFGLALVDELEGHGARGGRELVTMPVDRMSASRARGLRLASTFAARRGDTPGSSTPAPTRPPRGLRGSAAPTPLAALAHVLGEVALLEARRRRRPTSSGRRSSAWRRSRRPSSAR